MRLSAGFAEVRAQLGLAILAGMLTACSGPTEPAAPETGRVRGEVLVQRGVPRSIHGEVAPVLFPDEPLELHWVADGPDGLVAVALWDNSVISLSPTAILSFQVPAGCGQRYAVSVSSLPAGHSWALKLGYAGVDRNPCPATQLPAGSRAEWVFDLTALPASSTDPTSITITRLLTP